MCCVSTHQVYKVQGEYVDTASHSGQSADDGGENAETTCAEQKVLQRNMQSENVHGTLAQLVIKDRASQLFKS